MADKFVLNELTPEQEAHLDPIRDEWLAIGYSDAPTDRATAEVGIRMAYQEAGLQPPAAIIWHKSPIDGVVAAAMLMSGNPDLERRALAGEVDHAAITEEQRRAESGNACYGQHEASWLGLYDFFWRHCPGVFDEGPDPLAGHKLVARSAGWWWPMSDVCVATDRPIRLRADDAGRLHSEDGPAIQYAGDIPGYYWHGTAVDERVILRPETITLAEIRAEQNEEIRRILITRYGADRYIRDSGATLVHEDEWGALYSAPPLVDSDPPYMAVRVENSTPEPDGTFREFWLAVHPELRPLLRRDATNPNAPLLGEPQELTALNAVASTFGLTGDAYKRALVEQT